ncbi:TetR/AcrR family transcriptional regulator [Aquimarina sp. 2201CG5-10]|uniref:TetR/AcrR family transcriptional regulator n=1 Tax=Aquimarina callyspongiae TaxID=3098150 RepID=UPI002AB5059A|nr:TetR/AcrR family transcriptional regulator [Aquimarina sp. 2201CG5-10]MDY8136241.1 TetR/AcrR family transcriptional regulator [Aquimarina sp. 2201CG5-10]
MDKKSQIIEIATRLFSEKGYENTPISKVCEVADISKGLVFHHFKSKDGLLREIFASTTQLIVEMNQSTKSTQPPTQQLLDLLEAFFEQLKKDKMFFQLNLNVMTQPKTRELLNDLIKERSSFILDSVQSIFKQIDSENALIDSYLFIAELDGIALNFLGIFDNYPLDQIKDKLIKKYTSDEF